MKAFLRVAAGIVAACGIVGVAHAADAPQFVSKEGNFTIPNFQFQSGETIPQLRIHYTTLGTPKRDRKGHVTNAVLIMHGTGGDGHQFFRPQFADVLFVPGGLLDPAKYFIILPDDIGHGKSSKPSDGLHAHFPQYDYHDMVEAEHALVTTGLGVDHLRIVMGTSMGCMHSFMWGEMYPDMMDGMLPLACLPVQISGRNRLWRKMIIDGIRKDPAWKDGEYVKEPVMGLRIAADMLRMAGSAPLQMERDLPTQEAADADLDTYTQHELDTLDANDLLYQIAASRDYDPSGDLGKIKARVIWVNSADDFINPPELGIAEREARQLPHGRYVLIPISDKTHGHGTHTWAAVWQPYLSELLDETLPDAP